jgi:hypothetical protein
VNANGKGPVGPPPEDVDDALHVHDMSRFVEFGTVTEMSRTMITETVERQRIQRTSTPGMSALLVRAQSEYLEMPGLRLTEAQARRLWGLDGNTCHVVLVTLIERGFLKRAPNGHYVRARG